MAQEMTKILQSNLLLNKSIQWQWEETPEQKSQQMLKEVDQIIKDLENK
jgi:hypothetical protein